MTHNLFLLCCLSFLFSLSSCDDKTPTDQSKSLYQHIDFQGHRGARGLFPENSMQGFVEALQYDIQTLEMDVVVSKDRQLVISHEPWMSGEICLDTEGNEILETDHDKFSIYQMEYKDIKHFDCGSKGNTRFIQQKKFKSYKPTFKDVVHKIQKIKRKSGEALPHFNVELKSRPDWYGKWTPAPPAFVALTINELKELEIEDKVTLQSFDPQILNEIHHQDSTLRTSFLVENKMGILENLKQLNFTPDVYSPNYRLVNQAMLQRAHANNIKVIPWTINEVAEMKKLLELGVDGIITDYPNLIKEIRQ